MKYSFFKENLLLSASNKFIKETNELQIRAPENELR